MGSAADIFNARRTPTRVDLNQFSLAHPWQYFRSRRTAHLDTGATRSDIDGAFRGRRLQ
jgi:hypothetical protein